MTSNIALSLSKIAEKKRNDIGLIEANSGKKFSFGYLEKRSSQYAWHLRKYGVTPGDRVMLMVKPSADFICLTFALFKIGAPVILIDPGMGYKNLLKCVSGVKPDAFIGIPKAYLFQKIFPKPFSSIKMKFCLGFTFGLLGPDLQKSVKPRAEKYPVYAPKRNDLAAIIFTTGSTGPPKGVRYEHDIFSAQLEHIKKYYKITPNDIDQPAFPLFALFSTALGACAVIPDMDPTQPAKVNPEKFIRSINNFKVSYSFGSPALWNVVCRHCIEHKITLASLKKVLMAGAPVSGRLIKDMYKILPDDAEIHTPYGATECLPIVSIEGREIIEKTWPKTEVGRGTCVGRPLPGIDIRIIAIKDTALDEFDEAMMLPANTIGEIVVSGNVVTRSYDGNREETLLSKSRYEGKLWHRIGDTGYLDKEGRLWFCGRKAHRVVTKNGSKYTIPCEAIINRHDDVFRSALVGVFPKGKYSVPVMIVELQKNCKRNKNDIVSEIKEIGSMSPLTCDIEQYLVHEEFPVDIRHNAKIFREKLSHWAEEVLK